jgi:2'-hydroxyisoflavone reductase
MKVLIIGGTRFLGRALVDSALASGHHVTLFNRGQTNPNVYPDLETIVGDRETDLHKLEGRTWDAVIDTCGYLPRLAALSAQALKDKAKQYTWL